MKQKNTAMQNLSIIATIAYYVFKVVKIFVIVGAVAVLLMSIVMAFIPDEAMSVTVIGRVSVEINEKYVKDLSSIGDFDSDDLTETYGREFGAGVFAGGFLILTVVLVSLIIIFHTIEKFAKLLRTATSPFTDEIIKAYIKLGIVVLITKGVEMLVSGIMSEIIFDTSSFSSDGFDLISVLAYLAVLFLLKHGQEQSLATATYNTGNTYGGGGTYTTDNTTATDEANGTNSTDSTDNTDGTGNDSDGF